ncbi:MAG TPA: PTS sugar transporter subunit IIA [Arenicellales bacterium]|nr:PTS sugar transporter subunit IIA [Arenicellales bacterium]
MQQARITDLLDPSRVDLDCSLASKKRLMEHVAEMLTRNTGIDTQSVFRVLIERERLGSTGVGQGVALPHGRVDEIDDAILALATLHEPLDYQAPDSQNVQIVVGLLVPEQASENHLQILAQLARLLNRDELRDELLRARDRDEVFAALRRAEAE